MRLGKFYFASLIFLLFASFLYPQGKKTTIEEIANNALSFDNDAVEIQGLVTQYIPPTSSTTSYYLIKGDFGGIIKVNTAEAAPETNKKYKVIGTVYIDPKTKDPFISERSKVQLGVIITPQVNMPKIEEAGIDPLIYVIGGLVIVLIGVFIYFQLSKGKRGEEKAEYKETLPISELQWQAGTTVSGQTVSSEPNFKAMPSVSSEFSTIKIPSSSPKTLALIPGKLEIVSGEDIGKSFRIAGYPTPEGSVVSIGREAISGERAYAHIQLDERFKTVSRRQAELIYKDKKLIVKNLSETNLTQVDGKDLMPGECMELRPNARIKTGELEFQYKLN